jgi:rhodanese-related sulfurtransferase
MFLLLDGVGALLFVGTATAFGWLLQSQITSVLSRLAAFGLLGFLVVVGALGLCLAAKWLQRQLFIRSLGMSRITVDELRRFMDEGRDILILDVRPPDVRAAEGIIPGALAAHPAEIDAVIEIYTGEQETIVCCACPNEASAATAAKHLRRAGFKSIRPLPGGVDARSRLGNFRGPRGASPRRAGVIHGQTNAVMAHFAMTTTAVTHP